MRCLAFATLVISAALALGGCTTRSMTDEPVMLDVAGPVAVEVESFNGDVNVYVDESLDHGSVQVTRLADHGHLREDEARESLDEIEYSAAIESGPDGPVLKVRTSTHHPQAHHQRAHVTIYLPGVNDLYVRTSNGRVYARDVDGAADIETSNGEVRYMTNFAIRQPVTIVNDHGDINFRVNGSSAGRLTAETSRGEVDHKVQFGEFIVRERDDDLLIATLNGGDNPIDLQTEWGDIRFSVVENPTEVGMFIIDP